MILLVDTGVFSATLNRRRRGDLEPVVARIKGNRVLLTVQTVAELRFGALLAEWGGARRDHLEAAIASTTVVPVTDALVTEVAALRLACRTIGHPLADRAHANDLWIAATAVHLDVPLLTADRVFESTPRLQLLQ